MGNHAGQGLFACLCHQLGIFRHLAADQIAQTGDKVPAEKARTHHAATGNAQYFARLAARYGVGHRHNNGRSGHVGFLA